MESKECRLCHRIGYAAFVASGGENNIWECSNDRACSRRRRAQMIVLRLTQSEARNVDDAMVKYENWISAGADPEDRSDQAAVERIQRKLDLAGYEREARRRALLADGA